MLTVINVGICIGLSLVALMLLYLAYNVIWNIPDDQLARVQKHKVLCGVAAVLAIALYFLFPSNWSGQHLYVAQPISPRAFIPSPPPSVAAPTVAKPEETTQPTIYEQPRIVQMGSPVAPVRYEAPVQIEQQPVVHVDRWAAFSTTAQSVIAKELLNMDESAFQNQFTIQCLDATSSTRDVTSYGLNTSVVVVTGRYKISSVGPIDGQMWSKTFSVSETVFPDEFQGLDTSTTMVLLAGSLKEQLSSDSEASDIFKKTFK